MFDQQEQKLLEQALIRVRREYRNNCNVYEISAFDESFDRQLRQLVIYYSFDFEAIALHLYFKYPQYAHRLKPQAVSYRWYQLTLEAEGQRIQKELLGQITEKQQEQQERKQMELQVNEIQQKEEEKAVFFDWKYKMLQYQVAMEKALELDEEQAQTLMFYKPKFIIDTEFKLQRQPADQQHNLSALIQNQVFCQFGSFDAPQAAPLDTETTSSKLKVAPQSQPQLKDQQEETYLDDDWQAYESD